MRLSAGERRLLVVEVRGMGREGRFWSEEWLTEMTLEDDLSPLTVGALMFSA